MFPCTWCPFAVTLNITLWQQILYQLWRLAQCLCFRFSSFMPAWNPFVELKPIFFSHPIIIDILIWCINFGTESTKLLYDLPISSWAGEYISLLFRESRQFVFHPSFWFWRAFNFLLVCLAHKQIMELWTQCDFRTIALLADTESDWVLECSVWVLKSFSAPCLVNLCQHKFVLPLCCYLDGFTC